MKKRKDYETLLPWRDILVPLHCAFCNIHLENALPPKKKMDLCMIYCNSVACLCSKGISGQASIISAELEFVFSFEVSSFGIQFLPVSELRLILSSPDIVASYLSPHPSRYTTLMPAELVLFSDPDRIMECNLGKDIKWPFQWHTFWRDFIFFIKRILIILISYSNTSFSKMTMFSIARCCYWDTHYRYPININICTLAYNYM